jgi:hypothetical protein
MGAQLLETFEQMNCGEKAVDAIHRSLLGAHPVVVDFPVVPQPALEQTCGQIANLSRIRSEGFHARSPSKRECQSCVDRISGAQLQLADDLRPSRTADTAIRGSRHGAKLQFHHPIG